VVIYVVMFKVEIVGGTGSEYYSENTICTGILA
jgi:hypothetical protein